VFPLATRKSLAGSAAAFLTALVISATFWGSGARGMGGELGPPVWTWQQQKTGGFGGLVFLSVGVGIITSITEALGMQGVFNQVFSADLRKDLGFLDDNLTLPTIGGGAIWAFTSGLDLISRIF
jgi:diacylglycerol kinase (CTP)